MARHKNPRKDFKESLLMSYHQKQIFHDIRFIEFVKKTKYKKPRYIMSERFYHSWKIPKNYIIGCVDYNLVMTHCYKNIMILEKILKRVY